jgi:hypothetical protein
MHEIEDRCQEHSARIETLSRRFETILSETHKQDIQLTSLLADISHIKGRIDDGMSKTISNMDKKFDTLNEQMQVKIMPAINRSEFWVSKMQWIFIMVIGIGLTRIVWEFVDELLRKLING